MKQVVQPVSGGPVEVLDVPRPVISPTEVLVRTVASVISPGTERAVTALARSSLLAKARARPDLVRQVVRKAQAEGISATARAVRSRLDRRRAPRLLRGRAGRRGRRRRRRDQGRPAGGDGRRGQGQSRRVPGRAGPAVRGGARTGCRRRTRRSPPSRPYPLHALRLSGVGPGSKVVVLGLGLVGQLAARLAMASGCDVAGIDPGEFARETAASAGVLALDESGDATTEPDPQLVPGTGRGRRAGLRRRPVARADVPGPGAVPGPGRRGDGGRRGHAAPPHPVLRAGDLAAVRPVLRSGPVRAVLRGLGGRLPGRAGALDRGPEPGGGARPARRRPAPGVRPGHPVFRHRPRGRGLPAPGGADRALPGDPPHLSRPQRGPDQPVRLEPGPG